MHTVVILLSENVPLKSPVHTFSFFCVFNFNKKEGKVSRCFCTIVCILLISIYGLHYIIIHCFVFLFFPLDNSQTRITPVRRRETGSQDEPAGDLQCFYSTVCEHGERQREEMSLFLNPLTNHLSDCALPAVFRLFPEKGHTKIWTNLWPLLDVREQPNTDIYRLTVTDHAHWLFSFLFCVVTYRDVSLWRWQQLQRICLHIGRWQKLYETDYIWKSSKEFFERNQLSQLLQVGKPGSKSVRLENADKNKTFFVFETMFPNNIKYVFRFSQDKCMYV